MKIIISPAKKMVRETDLMEPSGLPVFVDRAEQICRILQAMDRKELQQLYRANDKITEENFLRLRDMDLRGNLTPALLAYVGIQYQSMAPRVFTDGQWAYVREHLYILSGFYGLLRAMDGVAPYRLEMQAPLAADGKKDLYAYWGSSVYEELTAGEEKPVIVNLASKEYSRAVEPYLRPDDRFISCVFGELTEDGKGRTKVRVKATQAKTARGSMVRFLAERQAEEPEAMKDFREDGFRFREELSGEREYVFVKQASEKNSFGD